MEKELLKTGPVLDRKGCPNPGYSRKSTLVYERRAILWVDNCCHQMFGTFCGKAVLDDGTELAVKDVVSFAEHAVNNW